MPPFFVWKLAGLTSNFGRTLVALSQMTNLQACRAGACKMPPSGRDHTGTQSNHFMKPGIGLKAGLIAAAFALACSPAMAGAGFAPAASPARQTAPLVLAQTDAGNAQLQEQVRQLNGRVEELTFQLLQMQEQLRKMQEDNEFRFQELEGGKRGALPQKGETLAGKEPLGEPAKEPATEPLAGEIQPGKLQPSGQDASTQGSDGNAIAGLPALEPTQPRRTIDGVEIYDGPPIAPEPGGLEPQTLGTLRFDENGNVIEAAPGAPVDLSAPAQNGSQLPPLAGTVEGGSLPPVEGAAAVDGTGQPAAPQGEAVASLEQPQTPDQLYDTGYGFIQAGDYKQAEATFRQFVSANPTSPKMGEASFWLGESIFAQRRYEESAKVFLDGHKKYPKSRMGAQNLLKLGVSLAGMNQRELACATFAEVPKKYPTLSNAVRAKVAAEQKAANCSIN